MSYILAIVIPLAFLGILHFTTEYSTQKKLAIVASLVFIISSAIYYNSLQTQEREHTLKIQLFYDQDKNISCYSIDLEKDIVINKKSFSFSRGTHTFIGKNRTPYYQLMVNVKECK